MAESEEREFDGRQAAKTGGGRTGIGERAERSPAILIAEDLPGRAVICSGDDDLVQEARRLGLTAFCKGRLDDLGKTLRQMATEGPQIASPTPIPLRRRAA